MKTRERILLTALAMFNAEGVSRVSTNHIADEMDISPGNLYYHFRNKDEIIHELFERFRRRMEELLLAPADRLMDMEDTWFYLHLLFETIWEYRFLYRNLVDLTQTDRSLRIHFNHLIRQKTEGARAVLDGLHNSGVLEADDADREAAAINIVVLTTYWLNFSMIRDRDYGDDTDLGQAVYQVLTLVAPMLREPERSRMRLLASRYL
ncbi:MAG: TetR/AcrR family transcriptional regulator [Pseudomonadota bacterium]